MSLISGEGYIRGSVHDNVGRRGKTPAPVRLQTCAGMESGFVTSNVLIDIGGVLK